MILSSTHSLSASHGAPVFRLILRALLAIALAVAVGACARRTAAPITDRKPPAPVAGPVVTPPATPRPVEPPRPAESEVQINPVTGPAVVETRPLGTGPTQPPQVAKPAPAPTPPARTDVKTEPRAFKAPYSDDNLAAVQRGEMPSAAPAPKPEARPPEPPVSAPAPEIKPPAPAVADGKPPPAPSGVPGPIARVDPQPKPPAVADPERIDWAWPAAGRVVDKFEGNNKGVGIAGRTGEPVYAAAGGRVVYSGSGLRGYGQLVIIKHNETYLSAYAHNSRILVKEGQAVTKGQKIAEMGSSDADRTKLHFEIRRSGKPVDPLAHLPNR